MKKIFVAAVAACMALAANAQVYVGGGVGLWNNSDTKNTSVSVLPEIGYTLNENMAIGTVVGVDWSKDIKTDIVIAPYFRYTFADLGAVKVFADAALSVTLHNPKVGDDETIWSVGVLPGIAIPVTDNISFVSHLGGIGYDSNSNLNLGLNGNNVTAGIYYNF